MVPFVSKTLLRGLTVIVPFVATVFILRWLIQQSERFSRAILTVILPERYYLPGMGTLLLLVVLFLIGLLMYSWLAQKIWQGIDGLIRRIPVISTVYNPVRDLMDVVGGDFAEKLGRPVMVRIPGTEMETLGFVTRRDMDTLPEGIRKAGHVTVYIQWASQIGGFCFIVPEDAVQPVEMSVEDGIRWSLTAGLSGPESKV